MLDMNVVGAWNRGFTGKGVVVTILDDGIEKDHPDLMHNYVRCLRKYSVLFVQCPDISTGLEAEARNSASNWLRLGAQSRYVCD